MHIIGTTGEGKSKFLEYLIRGDIDLGNGLCFLDPSDRGDTLYKVLAYCAKKKFKKVLLIDPHHRHQHNRIAPINPFGKYKEASVNNINDAIRVLFNTKDSADTPRIQRYLPAILSVLHNAGMTLHDSIYFTDQNNSLYRSCRMKILEQSSPLDRHRIALEEVFTTRAMFTNELQSTVRRLEPLYHSTLDVMFGSREGIDFAELIADGWVILVNLYSGFGLEPIHSKLLGTMIINQIVDAIDRLRANGWKGVYYLYIDEAGEYATRKLAHLLEYKRKSGLRVVLAHQYFNQFEDRKVLDSVLNLTKLKVAFNIPSREDRDKVVRMFYGGELEKNQGDKDISYALSNLRKQHAVIKKPKMAPVIVRIPDVPDLSPAPSSYIEEIYKQSFYVDAHKIIQDQKQRFNGAVYYQTEKTSEKVKQQIYEDRRKGTVSSKPSPKTNRRTNSKSGLQQPESTHQSWQSVSEQFEQRDSIAASDGQQENRPGEAKASTGKKAGAKKPQ